MAVLKKDLPLFINGQRQIAIDRAYVRFHTN